MKKLDIISFIAILLGFVALGMLQLTKLPVHIIVALLALILMLICMVKGKKDWKNPKLEILYRALYLLAVLTGIITAVTGGGNALAIVHKMSASVFAVLFIITFILKAVKSKKK